MQLTVLGCSGSVGSPDSAASGYLVTSPTGEHLLMDVGPGVLAQLQRYINPEDAHVAFTHLHPDHCLDFPSLLVWRRWHPQATHRIHELFGPRGTLTRLGHASSDVIGEVEPMDDSFTVHTWVEGQSETVAGITLTPFEVDHSILTYALRLECPDTGKVLTYSGDTAYCENIKTAARGADIFICEATWTDSPERPGHLHMSGREAGRLATECEVGTLVLTHIPPWADKDAIVAEATAEFAGPIVVAEPGLELHCTR